MMDDCPRLTTHRLLLRPFRPSDGAAIERLAGVREVADTTLTIPHPYPTGGDVQWIAGHAAAWARRENLPLALCAHAAPDELLGAIYLRISLAHSHGEIGYWIEVARLGQGLATEAAQSLIACGFDELALHRIQGRHFTRNAASGRLMQKLGMRQERIHRDAYRRFGWFEDVALNAVLDSDRAADARLSPPE